MPQFIQTLKQIGRRNTQKQPICAAPKYKWLSLPLKGSLDAHFPQVGMILLGLHVTVLNILWLKFLNGCVKQHPFYLLKNSSVHSNPFCCMSL